MIIDCFDPALRHVKDPYTGKEMKFKLMLRDGLHPLLFAPDAFSPGQIFDSAQKAFDALHRRDGMYGALGPRDAVVCPYTGKPMQLMPVEGLGYRWEGGFDPTVPLYSASEFIDLVRTRNGKLEGKPRHPVPSSQVAEHGTDITATDVDVAVNEPGVAAEETVREIVDGPAPKKTVVAVDGRRKKGKR